MSRKKINKTFTIEEATQKIIERFMEENNFSSYSVAFERIVIEWSIMKENKVNVDDIVNKVLEKLAKDNDYTVKYFEEATKEENKHTGIIKDIFNDMPE